jgi:hypothetical protein
VDIAVSVAIGGVVMYTYHKSETFIQFIKQVFSLLRSYLSSKKEDPNRNDNDGLFMATDKIKKGPEQSATGQVVDKGSFIQYIDEDNNN